MPLSEYLAELRYLGRVPGWGSRRLALYFEPTIEHMAQIEPLAREYIPDRMRGSPLLFYSRLLNNLSVDGQRLAGIRQQLFGEEVPTGLRSLNPGIGRGVLRTLEELEDVPEGTAESIALVPETVSELPVVAGILTERDCMKVALHSGYHDSPYGLVRDYMSPNPEFVAPEQSIFTLAEKFIQGSFRRYPVIDNGRLVGIISRRDVLRAIDQRYGSKRSP